MSDDQWTDLLYAFFFYSSGDHRDLHSFPTRRSSDLGCAPSGSDASAARTTRGACSACAGRSATRTGCSRSEEHTSELQSHSDLVCRLLLEKKKKIVVHRR